MISRALEARLKNMATWFPVVSLTGPRQSGKSTLIKAAFPEYGYLNLENPNTRKSALVDPVGFIKQHAAPLIIDEAQYAPELFSMIQVASDEAGTAGQYVLSGSQNFLLMKSVQQSLAGRVGMLKLLPLSYTEIHENMTVDEFMLAGGYPRIHNTGMPLDLFFQNYLATYVERDAGELLDVRNLASFRRMLGLCAANVGGLINYSRFAYDLDVSAQTVKSWLSILESSYIAFSLTPYYENARKRLTKAPKLYFYDTGLLCHLLHIETASELLESPFRGQVFENLLVSERMKHHFNQGKEPVLYFYRDDSKREIDLLDFTNRSCPLAFEVKSGQTYQDSFARHLRSVGDELGLPLEGRMVVYHGDERYTSKDIGVIPIEDVLLGNL